MNGINQSSGSHRAVWGKTVARRVHRPGVVSDRGQAARCENLEPLSHDFLEEATDFWSWNQGLTYAGLASKRKRVIGENTKGNIPSIVDGLRGQRQGGWAEPSEPQRKDRWRAMSFRVL